MRHDDITFLGRLGRLRATLGRQRRAICGAPDQKARAAFERACWRLGPGSIALDCGANIGVFTTLMAARGARVYAFEPNSAILDHLRERTADMPNVTVIPKAVATHDGTVRLYAHEHAERDPVGCSQGASMLSSKSNVSADRFEEVACVDLSAFLEDLQRPVALAKIDIEGAEIEVLRHLLETGAIRKIRRLFVEMHDLRIPELRREGQKLRKDLASVPGVYINLDWK